MNQRRRWLPGEYAMVTKYQPDEILPNPNRILLVSSLAMGLLLLFGNPSVNAQTAAGDGHALDANHARNSSRINTPRERFLLNEINNAIVTGNVAGGKGFRGDLGYRAAGDFHGSTGSNDLFSISAGSYLPGLIYQRYNLLQVPNARGAPAGRYQWSLQPATTIDRSMAGASVSADPFGRRSGHQQVVSDPMGSLRMVLQPARIRNTLVGSDALARLNPQLRSGFDPAEFELPDRYSTSQRQRFGYLRKGLSPYFQGARVVYPDLFGMARDSSVEPSLRGLPNTDLQRGTPVEQRERQLLFAEQAGTGSIGLKIGTDPFVDLVAEMIGEFNSLELERAADGYSDLMLDAIARFNGQFGARRGGSGEGRPPISGTPLVIPSLGEIRKLESNSLSQLSGHRDSQITRLARAGEVALGDEHFFAAERIFSRILDLDSENQLALAGLAHAQLGAGLFRSAAFNIRKLLTGSPEFATIQFSANLKPSRARLKGLIGNLRVLRNRNPIAAGGLLLAYAGRLAEDPLATREGLDLMSESARVADPLVEFLRAAWLAPEDFGEPVAGDQESNAATADGPGGVDDPAK